MWYCCVLVLTLQESGEIGQNQANNRLQEDLMRVAPLMMRVAPLMMRVASKAKATCDATLIPAIATHMMRVASSLKRVASLLAAQFKFSPISPSQIHSIAYISRSLARISGVFSLYIPDHLESRDQERRERLEIAWKRITWRRREDCKILSNPPWIFELHHDLPILSLFYAFFYHV
jgi:hypothetical protein